VVAADRFAREIVAILETDFVPTAFSISTARR
jgi:hypothetical protein